jgi:hypothetical protein
MFLVGDRGRRKSLQAQEILLIHWISSTIGIPLENYRNPLGNPTEVSSRTSTYSNVLNSALSGYLTTFSKRNFKDSNTESDITVMNTRLGINILGSALK